jgi:hypothetical protein
MDHAELLKKLEDFGFEKQGKTSAFLQSDNWIIGLLGLSGKYNQSGTKAFTICARPLHFKYMEEPKNKYSTWPLEYPFKFTLDSFSNELIYESQLLRFDYSRLKTEGPWDQVLNILTKELPEALTNLGVYGLMEQLKGIETKGYVEQLWIDS